MKAQILLFAGFDELDAIASFEVLQTAARAGADLAVTLVTLGGAGEVMGAHGLRVWAQATLALDERPDVLIVPGGGWQDGAAAGARREVEHGALPAALGAFHRAGTTIAGVCTGTMLLAAAGLLAGRPAITHHGSVEDLRAGGAEIVPARVVDDGDIITAGGVTSGLDLALWLVERYSGPDLAHRVEQEMAYERRGTVWRRPPSR